MKRGWIAVGTLVAIAGCSSNSGAGGGAATPGSSALTPTPVSTITRPATARPQHWQVVDVGYKLTGDLGSPNKTFVEYAVQIHNPNTGYFGSFPEWDVTAYGPHHRVMGTDQQTLGEFPPGATLDWSDQIEAQKPVKSVKVTYAGVTWSTTVTTPSDYPSFTVKGAHYSGGYSGTVTGTLRNPYPRAFSELAITALFFHGSKLLSGGTDFVDHFPAHSSRPFALNLLTNPPSGWNRMTVTAQPWGASEDAWNKAAYAIHQGR